MKKPQTAMGYAVRQKRTLAGLSQEKLASLLPDISRSQLAYFELGARTPSPEQLEEIASALDCDVNSLLYAEEEGSGAVEIQTFPGCLTEEQFVSQYVAEPSSEGEIVLISIFSPKPQLSTIFGKSKVKTIEIDPTSLFQFHHTNQHLLQALSHPCVIHKTTCKESETSMVGFQSVEYSKYHSENGKVQIFIPLSQKVVDQISALF